MNENITKEELAKAKDAIKELETKNPDFAEMMKAMDLAYNEGVQDCIAIVSVKREGAIYGTRAVLTEIINKLQAQIK